MSSTNIQIAVKIRPLIERELKEKTEAFWTVQENSVVQVDYAQNCYSFDHIFDQHKTNKDVYDNVVTELVCSCLRGINSTIFAYGQTSSGKTHTMLGDKANPGIINYAIEDIFQYISQNKSKNFLLRCSYLEIYNEKINDLLDPNAKHIKIREDCYQGVHVSVKEEVIREKNELFALMTKGLKMRKIGCTDMNERSSRSHTIFKLIIQTQDIDSEGSYTESALNLVDLAGSERVGQMNLKGERQAEGVLINKSLTTLGLVIRKLSENEQFVNYRDSKLTRLLQHSLGGNAKTLIICAITPAALDETKSTLEFAQRAKYVKNRPVINEKVTDKDQLKQYAELCQNYKEQIDQLSMERLKKEQTITALQDKIHNIELFSACTSTSETKSNKTLQRRHTMGHYQPSTRRNILSFEGITTIDECSDEELCIKHDTAQKTDRLSQFSSGDNPSVTPSKTLRAQKELLEESYESLKHFTSYEHQFLGQCNEIRELKELVDRLRNENISISQNLIKERESKIKGMEINKDVYDNLIFLKSVLEGNSVKEAPKKSLHTIVEEQLDTMSCSTEENEVDQWLWSKTEDEYTSLLEDNLKLKTQLDDIINTLKEKDAKENELFKKTASLEKEIKEKNSSIEILKSKIKQEKDTKEAELDILNSKLKKLNDYKEEMHMQLSKLQQDNVDSVKKVDFESFKSKHILLEEEYNKLQKEYESLKHLAGSNIEKLEQDNKRRLLLETELESQHELLKNKTSLLDEAQKEINDLRQVVKTEAKAATRFEDDLRDLTVKYVELENQNKLQKESNYLGAEIQELKMENHDLIVSISDLTANINKQQNLNLILESKLSSYDQLKQNLETITNENEDIKNKSQLLHTEISNLNEEVDSLNKKISYFENIQSEFQSKENAFNTEIRTLQDTIFTFKSNNADLESISKTYESLENENLELRKSLVKVEADVGSFKITIATLETEKVKILEDNKELQLTLKSAREKMEGLDNKLKEYSFKNKELDENLNNILQENVQLKESIKSITSDFNKESILNLQLRGQLSDLQIEITMLKTENSDFQNIKEISEQVLGENESLKNLLKSAQNQKGTILEINNQLKQENIHMSEQIQNLEKLLEKQNLTLKVLNDENKNFQTKLSEFLDVRKELDKEKKEYDAVNLQKNLINKEVEALKRQLELKTEELNNVSIIKEEFAAINQINNNLLALVAKLEQDKVTHHKEVEELKRQLELKTEELRNVLIIKEEYAGVNQEKNTLLTLVAELKQNKAQVENELITSKQMLDDQSQHLKLMEAKNTQIFKDTEKMRSEWDKVKQAYEADNQNLKKELSSNDRLNIINEQLRSDLKQLNAQMTLLKSENEQLKKSLLQLKKIPDLIRHKVPEAARALQIKNETCMEEVYTYVKDFIQNIQSKHNNLKMDITTLQKSVRALEENVQLKSKENRDKDLLIKELEEEISSYKTKISSLNDEISRHRELLDVYKMKISDKSLCVRELEKQKARFRKQIEHLEQEKNDICRDNAYLQENANKNINLIKKLEHENSELAAKIIKPNRQQFSNVQNFEEKENRCVYSESHANRLDSDDVSRKKMPQNILKEKRLTRLSDEGRSLSPNELRKIKRRSIHDQRRGLDVTSSEAIEISDPDYVVFEDNAVSCPVNDHVGSTVSGYMCDQKQKASQEECGCCKQLQEMIKKLQLEKVGMSKEIKELTEKNIILDEENEDMLKMIRALEEQQHELYEELEAERGSTKGTGKSDDVKAIINMNEEFKKQLVERDELIKTYNDKIVDMEYNMLQLECKHEKIQKGMERKISELQIKTRKYYTMEDKETQATCDMNIKYKTARELARWRQKEANYLRVKLKLPPDCPVLPDDVQRTGQKPDTR